MGKPRTAEDAEADLKETIREANGTIGDLRRVTKEAEEVVQRDIEKLVSAEVSKLKNEMQKYLDDFVRSLAKYVNETKPAIENRLAYLSAMCGADDRAVQFVAIEVLRGNGGTVDAGKGLKFHLVREEDSPVGPTFKFPEGTKTRVQADPRIEAAALAAVERFRPKLSAFTWRDRAAEDE